MTTNDLAAAIRQVPADTTWQSIRGMHPGSVVRVTRTTPNRIYFRILEEGAGQGPRARQGGPNNNLARTEFMRNYHPYTRRDWALATEVPPELDTVTPTIDPPTAGNGSHNSDLLHPQEEAIAEAIRNGAKYHDVQREYHVNGLTISRIIEKHAIPYTTIRGVQAGPGKEAAKALTAEAPPPAQLHPQEEEIAEVMRTGAATFYEVLRTYHISPSLASAIRKRYGVPSREDLPPEERRARDRAAYAAKHSKAAREAAAAAAVAAASPTPAEEEVAPPMVATDNVPTAASQPVVVLPPDTTDYRPQARWQVVVRTELTLTVDGADYMAAAQAALAAAPGAEVISIKKEQQ